jgi:hypothetical protein
VRHSSVDIDQRFCESCLIWGATRVKVASSTEEIAKAPKPHYYTPNAMACRSDKFRGENARSESARCKPKHLLAIRYRIWISDESLCESPSEGSDADMKELSDAHGPRPKSQTEGLSEIIGELDKWCRDGCPGYRTPYLKAIDRAKVSLQDWWHTR